MKSAVTTSLFILICLLRTLDICAQQQPLTNNPLISKLDSAVQKAALIYLQDSTANGLVIGITRNRQHQIYRYGENQKGSGLLTPAGLYYNIGSVAKTFVATILAAAVVERKAKLDDDIRKYLPGTYPNLQFNGVPIRLVDLANHTSGLPGTFHHYSSNVINSLKGKTLSEQAAFFATYNQDSLLLDLHILKPDTLPGSKFRYNSSAYMLLTLILENIYKQPYDQLVTAYLQNHLGLSHTMPILSEADLKKAAQGYDRNNKAVEYINLKGYFIGPTMNSTINDMVKFLQIQLEEKNNAVRLTHQQTFGKTDGFGIGLGWMINNEDGQRYLYHDGNTKIGFNTLCTIYPKQQLGVVIIANDVASQEKVGQLENNIRKFLE